MNLDLYKLTIPASKVSESVSNFPILINLGDNSGSNNLDTNDIFDNFKHPESVDDDFTGTDGDLVNQSLWSSNETIKDNKAIIYSDSSSISNSISSKFRLRDDFDIEIMYDITISSNVNRWDVRFSLSDSILGESWACQRQYYNNNVMFGIHTPTYSRVGEIVTTITNSGFRMTRVAGVITYYYHNGSSWVNIGSDSHTTTNDVQVIFNNLLRDGYPVLQTEVDNFKVNSGTIIWNDDVIPDLSQLKILTDGVNLGFDPLNKSTSISLSNNNKTVKLDASNIWNTIYNKSFAGVGSDKYFEIVWHQNSANVMYGVANDLGILTGDYFGRKATNVAIYQTANITYTYKNGSNTSTLTIPSPFNDGDVIGVRFVYDEMKYVLYKNGIEYDTLLLKNAPYSLAQYTTPCYIALSPYTLNNEFTLRTTSNEFSYPVPNGSVGWDDDIISTPIEIDQWDNNNKSAQIWTKLPYISSDNDTELTLIKLENNYSEYVTSLNPIAYWRLGESSGSIAYDELNLNNGIYYNNPTLGTTGLLIEDDNTAVTFIKANETECIVPRTSTFDSLFLNGGSVSFLIKPSIGVIGDAVDSGRIVDYDSPLSNEYGWSINIASDGNIGFYIRGSSTHSGWGFDINLKEGFNNHVCFVFDSIDVANDPILYINGVKAVTINDGNRATTYGDDVDNVITLGNNSNISTPRFLDGDLDEVCLFDNILTEDEIKELFNHSVVKVSNPDIGVTGDPIAEVVWKEYDAVYHLTQSNNLYTSFNPIDLHLDEVSGSNATTSQAVYNFPEVNTGANIELDYITVDLYIGNADIVQQGQIEISSTGVDSEDIFWQFGQYHKYDDRNFNIVSGWQSLKLYLKNGYNTTGDIDLNAIIYIRCYAVSSSANTIKFKNMIIHVNDDVKNSSIYDSTSNKSHGVLTNMDDTNIVDFGVGKGMSFDGVEEYIDMGVQSVFNLSNLQSMTSECIFKTNSITSIMRILQNQGTGSDDTKGGFAIRIYDDTNADLITRYAFLDSTDFTTRPSVYNTTNIYNKTLIFKQADGFLNTYNNGVLDYIDSYCTIDGDMSNVEIISDRNTTIGCSWNDDITQDQFMDGTLKEIRFSKTLKSDSWIAMNYDSTQDDLISYYNLLTKTILGTVFEGYKVEYWLVRAWLESDGSLTAESIVQSVVDPTFTLQIPFEKEFPHIVTVSPIIGQVWKPFFTVELDDLIFPTNTQETSFYYKCIIAGETGEFEPSFWPSGDGDQVADGSVTWEVVEGIIQPITHFPVMPI